MGEPFLQRLRQGPLLGDGAMGTILYTRAPESLLHGRCFDELVLTQPDLILAVHRDYIQAGAQVIETNTFGANASKLAPYGLGDRVRQINRRAADLALEARDVSGQPVFIAGAVGPSGMLGVVEAAEDPAHLAALRALFREQIEALVERGVDLLMLETFSNLVELREAVLAARDVASLPIVAQMTFSEDGQSLSGTTPASTAQTLAALQVDVLGVNCSIGPAGTLDAVEEMAAALRAHSGAREVYLSAQPNAGLPARVENRLLYGSTPHYFAEYARRFAEAGVRLIGGCCGTTPAHIAAMRDALADYLPAPTPNGRARDGAAVEARPATSATTAAAPYSTLTDTTYATDADAAHTPRTRLESELAAGRFVVSVELDPPKGLNPANILDGAATLKDQGVQFINIADSPMARVRMSCLAMARLLRDTLDLESIIHFTTRDRNLMALQADLLGAHALGIHNILALTGDPVRAGNYPNLTGVWNIDSVGLMRLLHGMNAGHDAAGASLGGPARFHIGAALNLNMEDELIDVERERTRHKLLDSAGQDLFVTADTNAADAAHLPALHPQLTETELELHRLRHKLDAGAQYIMTQPIYELAPLERFLERFGPVRVPILLGMIPLHSSKHAEYLHNEVPGITIPEAVRVRMREAGEHGRDVGIELAYQVIAAAQDRGLIQGCYLAPSYRRFDLVGELAHALLHRPAAQPMREGR